MNKKKQQWMEDVFQSMKGSQRATPNPELFTKIDKRLALIKADIMPRRQWRYAVAAAIFIVSLNSAALIYYVRNQQPKYENVTLADAYQKPLISSYQIY